MRYFVINGAALILLFCTPSWSAGQVAVLSGADRPDDKAPTTKLVLHPAAAPRPALRYQLLPPLLDRRPGNAAVLYNKTFAEQTPLLVDLRKKGGLGDKIEKWLEVPLSDPREKQLRKPFEWFSPGGWFFDNLDRAARCESCDWQLPIREQDFFSIVLPEFQQSRTYARLLRAKARIEIADGKYDHAIHTLQTGYALARHVASAPCLVTSLIGNAISDFMSKELQDWVAQPGSPNLYWALTDLPRPLIDFRAGLEGEMWAVYLSYPDLRNLDTAQRSPDQWRQLLEETVKRLYGWQGQRPGNLPGPLVTTAMALRGYPMAKRALIAWGRPAAEVEAMPVAQVIMIYTMRTYDELRDDIFKWFAVPSREGLAGAAEAEQSLRRAIQEPREILPIADILLPSLQHVRFAAVRADRTIAMLRIIEAIRLYGAAHAGRLPAELAEIKEVPIPTDPVTGKAFLYQQAGGTAVLESPPIPGMARKDFGVRYEIQFAKKGN